MPWSLEIWAECDIRGRFLGCFWAVYERIRERIVKKGERHLIDRIQGFCLSLSTDGGSCTSCRSIPGHYPPRRASPRQHPYKAVVLLHSLSLRDFRDNVSFICPSSPHSATTRNQLMYTPFPHMHTGVLSAPSPSLFSPVWNLSIYPRRKSPKPLLSALTTPYFINFI